MSKFGVGGDGGELNSTMNTGWGASSSQPSGQSAFSRGRVSSQSVNPKVSATNW